MSEKMDDAERKAREIVNKNELIKVKGTTYIVKDAIEADIAQALRSEYARGVKDGQKAVADALSVVQMAYSDKKLGEVEGG